MKVELVEADRRVLDNLAQLYQHDFSEFDAADVDESGRYRWFDTDAFFAYEDPHAFVIRVDDAIAGFVCMCRDTAFRDPHQPVWWMDQFFVLRKYRHRGVGSIAATQLFQRFPGAWEVAQMQTNSPAQAFWRKVIAACTAGRVEEFTLPDERIVQYFVT